MRSLKQSLSAMTLILMALYFSSCAIPPTGSDSSDNKAAPATSATSPTDQAAAPRQRYLVTETRVKPGLGQDYREFTRKETLPAYQKAGVKEISYYTTAGLGEAGEFVILRPIESLKELDEANPIAKALGEAGVRAWAARRAQLIVSSRSYLMQSRPELSYLPNPNEPDKLAFVTRQSIAPGRSVDFENLIRNDMLPLIKQARPKGYFVGKVGTGGDTEEYHTVVLVDSFAAYAQWTEALVKEGYDKVTSKRAGIVMRRESAVYRFIPELSLPQPTVAQNK